MATSGKNVIYNFQKCRYNLNDLEHFIFPNLGKTLVILNIPQARVLLPRRMEVFSLLDSYSITVNTAFLETPLMLPFR